MKKVLIGLVCLIILAVAAIHYRFQIGVVLTTDGKTIPLNRNAQPMPDAVPFGKEAVFSVYTIDPTTYAIAEPYSWAKNVNYLIIGEQRALLFDAGVGHFDIRPVVRSLTNLPITFMPSHFHFDHAGQVGFDMMAMIDLPHIREQADGDNLTPSWSQYLGAVEGLDAPTWKVNQWIKPGEKIDLGGRQLALLYTPGHTENSVSLFDEKRNIMFTGDYIARNRMSAYYPGSSLGDYLQTANKLVSVSDEQTKFMAAHAQDEPDLPTLNKADVEVLGQKLAQIKRGQLKGTGFYPVAYPITPTQTLSADPAWMQNWQPTVAEQSD